ncbi:hypothetical protein ABZ540_35765 [Nocardia xishanensis]|uniref:hypothetical protein n=1 Tax=Nocardia xishanensis TaxID=238964 RepID=UPI0033CECB9C
MKTKTCPRCGETFHPLPGRGRPQLWCSTECRRRAFEERRAAKRTGAPIEIREEIRERTIERSRPLSPDGAVERVLSDTMATEKLLRVLAHRMRTDPPMTDVQRWTHSRFTPLVLDLYRAHAEAKGQSAPAPPPEVLPAPYTPPANRAEAHRQAVALVLNSPRSTREVLTALADRARQGILASAEHTATVAAAEELLEALIVSRTLRPHRR